jgi:hypothetical protein
MSISIRQIARIYSLQDTRRIENDFSDRRRHHEMPVFLRVVPDLTLGRKSKRDKLADRHPPRYRDQALLGKELHCGAQILLGRLLQRGFIDSVHNSFFSSGVIRSTRAFMRSTIFEFCVFSHFRTDTISLNRSQRFGNN